MVTESNNRLDVHQPIVAAIEAVAGNARESGQFTLNMAEYAIESVVETMRSATESLAQNKKLALKTEVAKSLPIGLGDSGCSRSFRYFS
jgi:hypothetical protein